MSIVIAGGGMIGATLALAISTLTQGRLPVHLIEARTPDASQHPGFDARAIALAKGTSTQLAKLGVWQALQDCATPLTQVQVSDRGHAGFVTLQAEDYGITELGHVIELHDAGVRLFRLLRNAPGVTLHCPARVESVTRSTDSVTVALDNQTTVVGKVLVAADGTLSAVGKACGLAWQQDDYQQVAVIANVTTACSPDGRAFERFTANGPLAMLPMSGGRSSLVWCHPLSQQTEVMSWSDEQFCAQLQRAFGWRLGRICHAGERSAYPLRLTTAVAATSHRVVAVGNAAQTMHPIAGQGFNLGMRDVMSLAEEFASAFNQHQDPGSCAVLARYNARRSPDRAATIGVTDGLVHLFANQWGPLVVGRNIGLMAMDILAPVREALAKRTLGWVIR
ncbi:2-octaprenyl-6-methoxyphenyl hydroxylase [Mangrovibacter sp. MFB070]|uniref:2-octaprenyl-6-methoxyphenyl hydroxylase n=1 Tax=Mangrovibacter sp. MFB070 TaxID=1224318 RepID=UPI0004D816A8|nr:2-octaprenyl-6-methoxyphenyl hydroxylase [Mangrovibacter sp. MFB070]KEA54546.1 2-octaprenyl-6-methoxyphenyl hydroxylase [Mangrovibacter sp. MFB070]